MDDTKIKLGECKLFLDKIPEHGKFDRVHAILLTRDGRILLRYKNGEPRVTGGRIDPGDKDLEAALKREIREEINCEIDKCDYLGYIEAEMIEESPSGTKKTSENFARMIARISEIGEPKPDPDRAGNWIYGRALVSLEDAEQELAAVPKFGRNNLEVLKAAYKVAQEKNYFTEDTNSEHEVLNLESHD